MLSECWLVAVNLVPFLICQPTFAVWVQLLLSRGAHCSGFFGKREECSWSATVGKYSSVMSMVAELNTVTFCLVPGRGKETLSSAWSVLKLVAASVLPR